MMLAAPPGGRKAVGMLFASWFVRSLAESEGFSMILLSTIIAILSAMEGTAEGSSPLAAIAVTPSTLAFTTAAVAGLGTGLALLTEKACAGQSRQSEDNL